MNSEDHALLMRTAARAEIIDLFSKYAHAVDRCELGRLREVFSKDAIADYSETAKYVGGQKTMLHGVEEIIAFLTEAMKPVGKGLTHFLVNHLVEIKGDRATIEVHNQVLNLSSGSVYHCEAHKAIDGWRITKLVFEWRWYEDVIRRMEEQIQVGSKGARSVAPSGKV